jgi:non-heme chloroperoxidase
MLVDCGARAAGERPEMAVGGGADGDGRRGRVRTPDGVCVAVQEWGNPRGPEILFVHGFSQCHLSWSRQYAGRLAETFRMVTYDLRGHGTSGKPLAPEYYREGRRWADELACVMDHAGLRRPVVVAWSYGGRIVADYLACHGAARLAGINLVASSIRSAAGLVPAGSMSLRRQMAEDDLDRNISGTIAFLKACAERWTPEVFNYHLAFNMRVPAEVRGFLLDRTFDAEALYRQLGVPALFTHGRLDQITSCSASIEAAGVTNKAQLSLYDDCGHCPFIEDEERFNAELERFVLADCQGG